MYCMNCGVKLGSGEEKCPLCGLKAYHPDIPRTAGPGIYPQEWVAPKAERSGWRFLLTMFFSVALAACLLVDILMKDEITWSGFVLAGLVTGYIVLALPLWFSKPNFLVLLPVDFSAVSLMLLYINLATEGHWYLSFAFPVTALYGVLITGTYALARFLHKGYFFLLGGACIVFGCSAMLLELFLAITFALPMFRWSLYPMAVLCTVGFFWILCGIIRPLGDAIRKRIFL